LDWFNKNLKKFKEAAVSDWGEEAGNRILIHCDNIPVTKITHDWSEENLLGITEESESISTWTELPITIELKLEILDDLKKLLNKVRGMLETVK